jgi:hypothetical protein
MGGGTAEEKAVDRPSGDAVTTRMGFFGPTLTATVALALALAAPARGADTVVVSADRLTLNLENPGQRTVGRLVYRGGVALRSADRRFGGLSALQVSADGRSFVALSDTGIRFDGALLYDGGELAGVARVTATPLTGPDGQPIAGKLAADAEAVADDGAGGIVVAFERRHRLWRYPAGDGKAQPLAPPPDLDRAPANGGIEALARLADGRYLALTEDLATGSDDDTMGWIGKPGAWAGLSFVRRDGFKPTAAAVLPGGDVAVLERYYSLLGGAVARLRRIDRSDVSPGARLNGEILAVLERPLAVDNMEGVDARRGPDGETLLYLVSDDNFNPAQRTLLMMFELR